MESSEAQFGGLIQDGSHGGTFNMAADVYLTELAQATGQVILRLYSWEQPTLSLGFHQLLSEQQMESCRRLGLPIVRRPTGGRAVLHDRELTYALAIPNNHDLLRFGRNRLLKAIGSIFVSAAAKIGQHADLLRVGNHSAPTTAFSPTVSPLCFESTSRWEVHLSGRKWIGSAQRFLPAAFLQHGSILLGSSSVDLCAIFGPAGAAQNLRELEVMDIDLRAAIAGAFSQHWQITWQEYCFSSEEHEKIKSLSCEYDYLKLKIAS